MCIVHLKTFISLFIITALSHKAKSETLRRKVTVASIIYNIYNNMTEVMIKNEETNYSHIQKTRRASVYLHSYVIIRRITSKMCRAKNIYFLYFLLCEDENI